MINVDINNYDLYIEEMNLESILEILLDEDELSTHGKLKLLKDLVNRAQKENKMTNYEQKLNDFIDITRETTKQTNLELDAINCNLHDIMIEMRNIRLVLEKVLEAKND